jgi:hypothetical protein
MILCLAIMLGRCSVFQQYDVSSQLRLPGSLIDIFWAMIIKSSLRFCPHHVIHTSWYTTAITAYTVLSALAVILHVISLHGESRTSRNSSGIPICLNETRFVIISNYLIPLLLHLRILQISRLNA